MPLTSAARLRRKSMEMIWEEIGFICWVLMDCFHLQVQSRSSESGLPRAPRAFHPHGLRDEAHSRLWAWGKAPGRAQRGGPFHGALWQDPTAVAAHQHANVHGKLPRYCPPHTAREYTPQGRIHPPENSPHITAGTDVPSWRSWTACSACCRSTSGCQ